MSYQSEPIFSDNRINALCDFILETLKNQFPVTDPKVDPDYVIKTFILSGKAAKNLQADGTDEVKNITFETSDVAIYNWCGANLSKLLFNCKILVFKERILLYPNDFFLEIWLTNKLDTIYNNTIYVQNISSIPSETL